MKKVLSFVLVLAMILGSVSMVFAAPYTSAMTKITAANTAVPFADAQDSYVATILRDLGAVDGIGGDNVNLKGELTRAEGYAMIVKAMGLKDQAEAAKNTKTKFTDVKVGSWENGYVAVAAAQGYTDGTGAKTFSPAAKMTKDEAIAAVLKVLGYQDAHLIGAWPINYRDLALKGVEGLAANGSQTTLPVLTDVTMDSEVATRGDMLQVIYNCLKAQFVVWKENAIQAEYVSPVNGVTLVQRMTSASDPMKYSSAVPTVLGPGKVYDNGFDDSKFEGLLVTLLTKNSKEIGVVSSVGVFLEGTFVDGKTTTFKAIDGTLYTFKDAAPALAKDGIAVVNNAVLSTAATASTEHVATVANQTYKLGVVLSKTVPNQIDTIYSETSWTRTGTVMITASEAAFLATDDHKSFAKLTGGLAGYTFTTTDKAVNDTTKLFDKTALVVEGAVTSLAEIQENDIVEVFTATNSATSLVKKLVVTRTVVEGAVTGQDVTNDKIKVNGTLYSFNANSGLELTSAAAVVSASNHAFYLDSEGKIAYATIPGITTVLGEAKYAFVASLGYTKAAASTALHGEDSTTSIAIALVFAGENEVKDFENVSTGVAYAGGFVDGTTWVWNDSEIKVGTPVAVKLDQDGKIASIENVVFTAATRVTPSAIGIQGATKGYRYADNALVVELQDDAPTTSGKATYYKSVGTSYVEGNTLSTAKYVVNEKTGLVDIVVYAKSVKTLKNGEVDVISAAAFAGARYEVVDSAKTTYASFFVDGVEKEFVVYDGAADFFAQGQMYVLKLDGANIVGVGTNTEAWQSLGESVVTKGNFYGMVDVVATKGNIKLNAAQTVMTISAEAFSSADGKAEYAFGSAVTVYKYADNANKTAKVNTVAGLADIAKANTVAVFDMNCDGYIDLVLLNYIKADAEKYTSDSDWE